ncbi:MAG: hypothetical protein IJT30_06970 [Muribaculaceae bacterium]|nr:hypothetical protein [Muribaculaceae bacterium]
MLKHSIHIAVYGQVKTAGGADDTTFAFTYPGMGGMVDTNHWRSLFDPRDARDFSDSDVYAIWSRPEGNFYAIIYPARDGRNGRKMLAVLVANAVADNGSTVLRTLHTLRDQLETSAYALTNGQIEQILAEFDAHLRPGMGTIPSGTATGKGYRVYHNTQELERLLTYPQQLEYGKYPCVYLTPQNLLMPNPNFKQVTTPIRVYYQIAPPPAGVSVIPQREVSEDDTLIITYSRAGFEDVKKTVNIMGSNTPLFTIAQSTINIHDARTAGITFGRKVLLQFYAKGTNRRVGNVSIRQGNGSEQIADTVLMPETAQSLTLHVRAAGYHDTDIEITQLDVSHGHRIVELIPRASTKRVTIVLPNGSMSHITAEISQTDPLYRYMQQHGEYLYLKDSRHDGGGRAENGYRGMDYQRNMATLVAGVAGVIVTYLLLAWLWLHTWPFNESPNEADKANSTNNEQMVDAPQADNPDNQPDGNNSKADLETDWQYMKDNDIWVKVELKSDECRMLCDYIENGQVQQAINHPYKSNPTVNEYWTGSQGFITIYEEIRGSVSEENIANAMRKCASNKGTIDLKALSVSMSSLRDKHNQTGSESETTSNPNDIKPSDIHHTNPGNKSPSVSGSGSSGSTPPTGSNVGRPTS